MSTDRAIKVSKVSKYFMLPHEKKDSVKSVVTSIFHPHSRIEHQHALKNISFDIKPGEFFGIVGRNGSGKSTLLKILAGIYQPSKGSVSVNGKLVPFIELGVGFNPELTGRENVFLNGALLGFSPKEVQAMYHDIVAFAELERFMDQKLKNYSSGMQVRLAFSVAIMAEADILLIDEVLAVGDADFQRKCFDYFKSLKKRKKTVVFVSHDMSAVQQYCDRAVLIDKSEIIDIGDPATIAMQYNKLFMQEASTTVNRTSGSSPSGEARWGDGEAAWDTVSIKEIADANNQPIALEVTARGTANQAIDYPIFGFSIKDSEFKQITGMNSVRKQRKIAPLAVGQSFAVTWRVPNIFNNGLYYVDCTIAHDQPSLVSDRWPDAASFTVERLDNNPYPVYTDAELLYNFND
jgi:ABC-2 type transport system ATP-binding protein